MIKILVVSPFHKDANSYHRCVGPWAYLAKEARRVGDEIEFQVAGDDTCVSGVAWSEVIKYDMVFMHRPCRTDDVTIMKVAKMVGVPVWVDYDDWLFDVPFWNPHAHQYANPALQNNIATCLGAADLVSVTTGALFEKFAQVNPNVVIVPNQYWAELYPYRKHRTETKNTIAWRGSNTHDADLMSVMDAWPKMPAPVSFYGGAPWQVLQHMEKGKYSILASQDPFYYMRQIYDDAPKVVVVPLVDCLFNRVKSNIAYQEALHAGALCVAPDLPEWRKSGVITYAPHSHTDFLKTVESAMSTTPETHADMVEDAFADMTDKYGAKTVNKIRLSLVHAVTSSAHQTNPYDANDPLLGMWVMSKMKPKPPAPGDVPEEVFKNKGYA